MSKNQPGARLRATICLLAMASFFSISPAGFAAESDPYESVNRKVFAFNEFLDRWLLKPVAKGYQAVTPGFVDDAVTNVFDNLAEIRNLLNAGLQGDGRQMGVSTGRFLLNSTVGLVGIFDVASDVGLAERKEDFGQTLATWGVGSGPYIVLPILGGSNLRDAFSIVPDVYSSPITYIDDNATANTLRALDLVDTRADLLDAEQLISGDRYTFLRELYQQNRAAQIVNGAIADDFEDDFGDEDEEYDY